MKTLDEVIDMIECHMKNYCAADYDEPCLHYLKEYRRKRDELERTKKALFEFVGEKMVEAEKQGQTFFCPNCGDEFILLPEVNDPLSWDELRQMEGKPVWVEEPSFFGKRWVIISGMNDEAVFGTSIGSQVFYCKENQGTQWQAYRKERIC